jgi:hypothetical protein
MSPREQEELAKALKLAHPKWSRRFISGYVHGAAVAADQPDNPELTHPSRLAKDGYGKGMMLGFAVRQGRQVEPEPFFGHLGQ